MPHRPYFFAAAIASAVALGGGVALAEPSPADRAAARVLFDEARRAMQDGKFAAACPKLEESQRIDPGMGTQFNLAECQEKIGKLASAWENFLEVANNAKNAGQNAREAVARGRAATLAPKLGKLVVTVDPKASEVSLKRDGVEIRKPLWGTPVPVDAGDHEIIATAPGKLPFKKTLSMPEGPETISFAVPPLADAPPDAPGEAPVASAPSGMSSRRIAGIVVTGAGVVGLGVGGILGLVAKGKADVPSDQCDPNHPNVCTSGAAADKNSAVKLGNVATGVFVGGAVLAAAGVVLIVTAPSSANGGKSTGLAIGPGSVAWKGTF